MKFHYSYLLFWNPTGKGNTNCFDFSTKLVDSEFVIFRIKSKWTSGVVWNCLLCCQYAKISNLFSQPLLLLLSHLRKDFKIRSQPFQIPLQSMDWPCYNLTLTEYVYWELLSYWDWVSLDFHFEIVLYLNKSCEKIVKNDHGIGKET